MVNTMWYLFFVLNVVAIVAVCDDLFLQNL